MRFARIAILMSWLLVLNSLLLLLLNSAPFSAVLHSHYVIIVNLNHLRELRQGHMFRP